MVVQRIVTVACILLSVLVIPDTAEAGITFVSQDRSVWASNSNGDYAGASASDFGPFNAAVNITHVPNPIAPDTESWPNFVAEAEQSSSLSSRNITAEGSAREVPPFFRYEGLNQAAQSYLAVTFALDCPSEVAFSGWLNTAADVGGTGAPWFSAEVTLSDEAGGTIYALSNVFGDPSPELPTFYNDGKLCQFDERLFLDAGIYNLEIDASVQGFYDGYDPAYPDRLGVGGEGHAGYGIELTVVPAPAALSLLVPGFGMLSLLRRRHL